MTRLPQVGGDAGTWGQVLNDYLSVAHNNDGSLKAQADIDKADTAIQSVNGKTGTSVTLAATDVSAEPAGLSTATKALVTSRSGTRPVGQGELAFNVKDYGALGTAVRVVDAVMDGVTATVTSSSSSFTTANIGQAIRVAGAGAAGADLISTISAVTNSHSATLANASQTAVSAAVAQYGPDDSVAIMAADTAAGAVGGTVYFPPGRYQADSLTMAHQKVTWLAPAAGSRFGANSAVGASVAIQHAPGSSNTLLNMNSYGITLEGIYLDGNNAPGTVLAISKGFENRLKTVRCAYGAGIGLLIGAADNATFSDIFVENCGSATAPQVSITVANPQTINTLNIDGLNIERAGATTVDLDINSTVDDSGSYPFVVRLDNLHVEHPSDNGSVANTGPMITAGNFTTVVLTNPFIYGGPGPLIQFDSESTSPGLGGLVIIGGHLRGRDSSTGDEPATLVHLVKGSGFAMMGTTLASFATQAILVDSTFGNSVLIDPTVWNMTSASTITDNRASTSVAPYSYTAPIWVHGSAEFPNTQNIAAGIRLGRNTSGDSVVSLADGTRQWQIDASSGSSTLNFVLAGTRNLGTFNTAGDFSIAGAFTRLTAVKTANYTISHEATILASGAGTTITLPTAASVTGKEITVRNTDASNTITLATTSSQTIDGATTFSLTPGQSRTFVSDGSNWWVIGGLG